MEQVSGFAFAAVGEGQYSQWLAVGSHLNVAADGYLHGSLFCLLGIDEPSPDDPISSEDNIPKGHQSVVNMMPPSYDPGLIPPCEYLPGVSLNGHGRQKTLDKTPPVSKSQLPCIGSESSVDEDPARVSSDSGPNKDLGLMATNSLSPSISDAALLTSPNTQLSSVPISNVNDSMGSY
ncbi:hypothetical protein Nepgr_032285 [Nepenthes gracilis]|uniref:Uncharacterized protein n=1 Tax=Nepenthes gracilis TaxID=150966 RepID=A0AAD3TJ63_NEPGR|nr:hypothetical protein Nepgr_032285 [Nepenthes gracilis]